MKQTRALVERATDTGRTLAERHAAFDDLVRLFQDMAFACACGALCGDFHLAEDAAQNAFVTAWRKLPQLREPEAFPGWLRRIVLTECSRLTRGSRLKTVPLEEGAGAASAAGNPEAIAEWRELSASVREALRLLPRGERVVATLFYFDSRSHKEIADILQVPRTTVAKRLHAARARLRGGALAEMKDRFEDRRPSRDEAFAARVRRGMFDDYLGRYRYEQRPELEVTITREDDRLFAEAAGQRNELLARDDDDAAAGRELRTREFDGRGEFIRDRGRRVTHFVYYEFGREMGRAKKIS
ncbi:MAG: sigma-70 family RNA polymerase sigma factor [Acidobacteria bacterium]|nr:sigma-70 family RNA polymerase sigma factor [Acidobacteriota bacterium]